MLREVNTAADKARALEEDLEDEPERAELLPGVADAWREAGDHARAAELLAEAIDLGVEDLGTTRVALARELFELGRATEARAALDDLHDDPHDGPEPFDRAANLLRDFGQFAEAVTWYEFAIARMDSDDEPARSYVILGRRQVRKKLGLPPDELDDLVEPLEREMRGFTKRDR